MDSENEASQNGQPAKVSQIVLTFDREKFLLTIGGKTENYNEALCMLEMARREIESQARAVEVGKVLSAPAGVPFRIPRPRGN